MLRWARIRIQSFRIGIAGLILVNASLCGCKGTKRQSDTFELVVGETGLYARPVGTFPDHINVTIPVTTVMHDSVPVIIHVSPSAVDVNEPLQVFVVVGQAPTVGDGIAALQYNFQAGAGVTGTPPSSVPIPMGENVSPSFELTPTAPGRIVISATYGPHFTQRTVPVGSH